MAWLDKTPAISPWADSLPNGGLAADVLYFLIADGHRSNISTLYTDGMAASKPSDPWSDDAPHATQWTELTV